MSAVPALIPVTSPVDEFTVAILVLAVLQVPPVSASESSVVYPVHTVFIPVIAPGIGFTVTVLVAKQPLNNLYVIVLVPAVEPVTTPPLTVAIVVLLLLQKPPEVASVSVVVLLAQTIAVPVIAAGGGLSCSFAPFVVSLRFEFVQVSIQRK